MKQKIAPSAKDKKVMRENDFIASKTDLKRADTVLTDLLANKWCEL